MTQREAELPGDAPAADSGRAPTLEDVATQTTWRTEARERLTSRGATRWYFGSIWGIAYLAIPVALVWGNSGADVMVPVLMTALVLVIGAVYVVIPPLIWGRSWAVAAIVMVGFLALTCLAFPLVGVDTIWFWIYVPIMSSMTWQSRWFSLGSLAAVVLAQLVVVSAAGRFESYWYAAALTASIGIMMFGFSRQIQTIGKLRAAQSEIARLAVVEERERFAHDMHDVLGHSLTVVTVKSELARKLVARDPARAETELEDIERLTRSALVDLRASVAGYREMSLPTELTAAHAALVAADIVPHLPAGSERVDPGLSELFARVLRESVTNVIRHSNARNCWVALEPRSIVIGDDGRGGAGIRKPVPGTVGGSGLAGLAARAEELGVQLTVEPADGGGTVIAVRAMAGARS